MVQFYFRTIFLLSFLGVIANIFAVQELPGSGNDFPLPNGDVSTRSKSIADNYYESQGGGSATVDNVNLFNLTSSYSIPIGGIEQRGQLAYNVSLNYNGNIWASVMSDNEKAPTLPIGLGWRIGSPFVAINHKGTTTYTDDVVYCDLGPFGGGQLLQNQTTGRFFLASNPAIKISTVVNSGGSDLDGQIESWIFSFPNGQKMIFGNANDGIVSNSERVVLNNGPLVQASTYSLESNKPFIYRWDISIFSDPPAQSESIGRNQILFEYSKFDIVHSNALPTKTYTQESYIKKISALDVNGNEYESLNFTYSNADPKYYVGNAGGEPLTVQKLFESKSLDKIEYKKNGLICTRHTFNYSEISAASNPSGAKRLLASVGVEIEQNGKFVNHGSYTFTYGTGGIYDRGNLLSVVTPDGQKKVFEVGANIVQPAPPTFQMLDPLNNNQVLHLPGDVSNLEDLYKVRTTCSDRFCYITVTSTKKEDNGLTYLNVYHNTGRYWHDVPLYQEKITSQFYSPSFGDQISVIPMGDRFYIVKRYEMNVQVYEWNGNFFHRTQIINDFNHITDSQTLPPDQLGISLFPSTNYFIIHERESTPDFTRTSRIRVYLKNGTTGIWDHITDNSNCQVDNSNAYGYNVKLPTRLNKCFEFANFDAVEGSNKIQISVSGPMFTVVDGYSNIIFAYVLNKNGTGFDNISGTFLPFNSFDIWHDPDHPNHFSWNIKEPIYLGADYFVIKVSSVDGDDKTHSSLHVFHYDGVHIRRICFDDWERDEIADHSSLHNRRILIGPDYFITSNMRNDLERSDGITGPYFLYWKKIGVFGSDFATFVKTSVPLPGIGDGYNQELLIETHPKSFFVSYYRNGDQDNNPGFPSNPPVTYQAGTTANPFMDYRSYLYMLDNNRSPVLLTDAQQPRDQYGRKYVNMWYSPTDNDVIAKSYGNASSACDPGATCNTEFRSFQIFPNLNDATKFVGNSYSMDGLLQPGESAFQSQDVTSSFTQLFARAVLVKQSANQSFLRLQLNFSGPTQPQFGNTPRILSVSDYVNPLSTENIKTTFEIVDNTRRCYNRRTGNMDQEEVKVKTGTGNGYLDYLFYLDLPPTEFDGTDKDMSGRVRSIRTYKEGVPPILSSTTTTSYAPSYQALGWPANLYFNQISSITNTSFSSPLQMSTQTLFEKYDIGVDGNGLPQFSFQSLAGSRWLINQTVLNSLHLPIQSVVYTIDGTDRSTAVDDALGAPAGQPFRNLGAVASNKTEYSSLLPYLPVKSLIWRDQGTSPTNTDQPLSNDEMKTGVAPVLKLDRGFQPISEITRVNQFNQPVETKAFRASNRPQYNSVVYEGKGSWPSATFSSCRADNCAGLLGENGDLNSTNPDLTTTTVDLPNRTNSSRWRLSGATFDASRSHTGKYSFKVVSDSGAVIDLHLKDVRSENYDYVISAWIYAIAGSIPALNATLRQFNGTSSGQNVGSFFGAPISGIISFGKWQRWELKITNAQLISAGLFSGNDDFLRLQVGTTQGGGVVFVDDIVCHPAHSDFTLRTYNEKGQVTSVTGANHLTRYFDVGYLGNIIAVRDENYRIFGQAGANRFGENP